MDFIERIDRDPALHCPKLLLLDLHLPKRDGREVLRCLRASECCGQTPVVILTSSDSPSDLETATARHFIISGSEYIRTIHAAWGCRKEYTRLAPPCSRRIRILKSVEVNLVFAMKRVQNLIRTDLVPLEILNFTFVLFGSLPS